MALKIRLARAGAKKRPQYRIVVADSRMPRDGRFLEKLGTYNPLKPVGSAERVTLKAERIAYWLDKGAKPTDRVGRLLGAAEIIPMPARRDNPKKAKPKAKAQERLAAEAEAAKAAAAIVRILNIASSLVWSEIARRRLVGAAEDGGLEQAAPESGIGHRRRRVAHQTFVYPLPGRVSFTGVVDIGFGEAA